MDKLTRREQPDRSKIDMDVRFGFEVKYWTHQLGVCRERLQRVADKVGHSAATVRKELGLPAVSHLARFPSTFVSSRAADSFVPAPPS